jgi:RimJ/RimL family protein N-acetyltransferase
LGEHGWNLMAERTDDIVTLSPFRPTDAPVLFEVDHDPEHRRRFDFPDDFTPSLRHSQQVIARWESQRAAGERFPYAVRSAAAGEILGGVELRPLGDRVANLSYWTVPRHRRRGVASRAVSLACRLAFLDFGFRTIRVLADADNIGSRRVAVRNGFHEVGLSEGRICYVLESTAEAGTTSGDVGSSP